MTPTKGTVNVRGLRVFISGPMTGRPHYNAGAFLDAHVMLKELGAEHVYDPALRWLDEDASESAAKGHEDYMRQCLHELTNDILPYDLMVQLPGWEDSEGAIWESWAAEWCGIPKASLREVTG